MKFPHAVAFHGIQLFALVVALGVPLVAGSGVAIVASLALPLAAARRRPRVPASVPA